MAERGIGEARWTPALLSFLAMLLMAVLLLLPLLVVFIEALKAGLAPFLDALLEPDAVAAVRLTLAVTAVAVPANAVFGLAAAWCITRHRFRGRRLLVSLIGLPFSVSPVIAGLVYVLLFGSRGWFGAMTDTMGIKVLFAMPGLVLATVFVTLPYIAAQLIPLMDAQGPAEEEAGLTLGANGWQVFLWVTLPRIRFALLQGVLLCTARAMGEFGAVSVVSGHVMGLTNTMPLYIEAMYNQYDLAAAFGMAAVLASLAVVTMFVKAVLEWRQERAERRGQAAVLA